MTQTLYATYNGHVLMPEGNVDLLPNHRYVIHIANQEPSVSTDICKKSLAHTIDTGFCDISTLSNDYVQTLSATLSEWNSEEDEEAWHDL